MTYKYPTYLLDYKTLACIIAFDVFNKKCGLLIVYAMRVNTLVSALEIVVIMIYPVKEMADSHNTSIESAIRTYAFVLTTTFTTCVTVHNI